MAVSVTGTPTVYPCGTGHNVNSGTASSTITVPADCDYILCGVGGFSTTANFFGSGAVIQFTKGGVDTNMTYIGGAGTTAAFDGEVFGLVAPDTGTNKTLKFDFAGAGLPSDDTLLSLLFLKGVDPTTPTRDVEFISKTPAFAGAVTPSISASSGDKVIGFAAFYPTGGGSEGSVNTVSNCTIVANLTHQNAADCAWLQADATGAQTIGVTTTTNADDGTLVGVALIPAAVTAALVAPTLQPKLWLKLWRFAHIVPTPPITAASPYTLGAEPGTLTLSGQTAGLKFGHALTAGTGTLALSGQDVVLRVTLPVNAGTLTLAGQTAVLRATRTMLAGTGTLTLSGQDAALRLARKAVAGTGTLTLSGQTVGLRATHLPLTAGLGTLTLSGRAVNLPYGRKMTAGLGTLTLSGQAVTLKRSYVMPVQNGMLTLAGQTVILRAARRMTAGLGTLTLAGQAVAMRIARKAVAGLGTLTLSGQTVALKRTTKMPVGTGTLQLVGPTVNLVWSASGAFTLPAGVGVLTASGQTATLRYGHKAGGLGALTLAGQSVSLRLTRQLVASNGTLTLAGQPADLVHAAAVDYTLTASPGMLALSGQAVMLDRAYATAQPGRIRFGQKVYLRRW